MYNDGHLGVWLDYLFTISIPPDFLQNMKHWWTVVKRKKVKV